MVSQGIANPSTKLNWCSGSNPDGGVKDICSANVTLLKSKYFENCKFTSRFLGGLSQVSKRNLKNMSCLLGEKLG